ncbi:hypothetical protein HYX08_05475 [Candidatus Woesearchaeota archaeon]|nr:hypothetical protein [Candidatus Woesearchaeota archaeon]
MISRVSSINIYLRAQASDTGYGVKPVSPVAATDTGYDRMPPLTYEQLRELMEIIGTMPRRPLPEAVEELLAGNFLDIKV